MQKKIILILLLSLNGCSSYRPIPTEAEHMSFRSYVNKEMIDDKQTSYNLKHVDRALETYSNLLLNSLREKATNAWNVSNITTAGGAAAIIGGITEKTGLLNTGLGIAGLGFATSSQAKLDEQISLTLVAYKKLSCVKGYSGSLTEKLAQLVRTSGDQDAIAALASAPEDTIRSIINIQDDYLVSMYALKPSAPSSGDLTNFFDRLVELRTATTASLRGRKAQASPETEAAIKTIKGYKLQLEACNKFG
ncbi:hypothetical protein [Pseudomonas sp.]|uniref:hypothetical protein n=1 Tax=Pseudomonas sp. TaxID=306 RepID=UPI002487B0A7|nr:hypothetical protein [Pseudomonas sp.]MDI1330899.1 hypothetical protein [Pseudomonas sp.]